MIEIYNYQKIINRTLEIKKNPKIIKFCNLSIYLFSKNTAFLFSIQHIRSTCVASHTFDSWSVLNTGRARLSR